MSYRTCKVVGHDYYHKHLRKIVISNGEFRYKRKFISVNDIFLSTVITDIFDTVGSTAIAILKLPSLTRDQWRLQHRRNVWSFKIIIIGVRSAVLRVYNNNFINLQSFYLHVSNSENRRSIGSKCKRDHTLCIIRYRYELNCLLQIFKRGVNSVLHINHSIKINSL